MDSLGIVELTRMGKLSGPEIDVASAYGRNARDGLVIGISRERETIVA